MDSINKNSLISNLKDGIVSVTFTKVDGTERTMKATLKESLSTPGIESVAEHTGLITVWDTEKSAYRTFREDSVISYAVE